jgi:hypothetical protein
MLKKGSEMPFFNSKKQSFFSYFWDNFWDLFSESFIFGKFIKSILKKIFWKFYKIYIIYYIIKYITYIFFKVVKEVGVVYKKQYIKNIFWYNLKMDDSKTTLEIWEVIRLPIDGLYSRPTELY